jgi:NifU-like protein involved in Fe-S cluster formation
VPYSEALRDHLANPRNAGTVEDADADVELTNPVCGDRLRLTLRVGGGRVLGARFLAYGCPPTIACGSALAELVQGKSLEEAARLTRQDVTQRLGGLPARKGHAAALAVEALRAALSEL